MNRRRLLGSGAAAIAAAAVPNAMPARDGATVEMVAGGGAVETPLGLVDFGLVARRNTDGTVAGDLTLRDTTQPGNPIVLLSKQLSRLEPVPGDDDPASCQLVGWVATGEESTIFALRVTDRGVAGSGADTFTLAVGQAAAELLDEDEQAVCDCAVFSYRLTGAVVHGDMLIVPGK